MENPPEPLSELPAPPASLPLTPLSEVGAKKALPPRPYKNPDAPALRRRDDDPVISFLRAILVMGLLAGLIWFGWNESFAQRRAKSKGETPPPAAFRVASVARAPIIARPTTVRVPGAIDAPKANSGDWLWDPARKTPLDPPVKK